jgi:hypothetical protein
MYTWHCWQILLEDPNRYVPSGIEERWLLLGELFIFRPTHNKKLHLVRTVERVNRNCYDRRFTGVVSLDVGNAVDTPSTS